MQAAEVLSIQPKRDAGYQLRPAVHERVRGNGRAIMIAKLRELADKLERGEIDGCRAQWLDTHGALLDDDGQAISGMEYTERSAYRDDGSGTVQLKTVTIEEV